MEVTHSDNVEVADLWILGEVMPYMDDFIRAIQTAAASGGDACIDILHASNEASKDGV